MNVEMEWQPIETAPDDKTKVLVCCNDKGPIIAHQTAGGVWVHSFLAHDSKWRILQGDDTPTHWQPLPEAPK